MNVVEHTSREADFTLNFSTTENNLSWSFTAENDGEVFADNKTNIASYTINGSAVTFPFALVGGSSYSVSVVKTTNGQSAAITLKTRRATNKVINYSVPDIGAYDGRYLYVLINNNTVQKLDSQLLLPSNYAGAGVWTVSPVVATISLPTLPNSATYTKLKFVKSGGTEKILIVGQVFVVGTGVTYFYASYLSLSNDTVYDLTLTSIGGYTNFLSLVINLGGTNNLIPTIQYDYINEFVYILSGMGANGTTVIKLNLLTNVSTNLGYSSFAYGQMTFTKGYEHQFSPIDLQFIAVGDYSLENSRTYNCKTAQNNSNIWGYNYRNNYRITTGATFGNVTYINSSGAVVGGAYYGTIGVYGCTELYGFDKANTVFMTFVDSYAIVNRNTSTSKYRTTDKELVAPNNYLLNLRNCHYSNIYVAFCGTSGRVLSTRMVVFKESETNADFGYLDFANTVYSADVNQLLL